MSHDEFDPKLPAPADGQSDSAYGCRMGCEGLAEHPAGAQPCLLSPRQVGRAVLRVLKGRRNDVSPLSPAPEAVDDAFDKLCLGFHELSDPNSDRVAAYFARLPADVRKAILSLLDGPGVSLEKNPERVNLFETAT